MLSFRKKIPNCQCSNIFLITCKEGQKWLMKLRVHNLKERKLKVMLTILFEDKKMVNFKMWTNGIFAIKDLMGLSRQAIIWHIDHWWEKCVLLLMFTSFCCFGTDFDSEGRQPVLRKFHTIFIRFFYQTIGNI